MANLYYTAFLACFYGLVFSASIAVLLKHQRRVARRHRRRLRRHFGATGNAASMADDGGAAAAAAAGSSDVWGNSLSAKEIGDLAWNKFLVWAGFKPAPETGKTNEALSAVRNIDL